MRGIVCADTIAGAGHEYKIMCWDGNSSITIGISGIIHEVEHAFVGFKIWFWHGDDFIYYIGSSFAIQRHSEGCATLETSNFAKNMTTIVAIEQLSIEADAVASIDFSVVGLKN